VFALKPALAETVKVTPGGCCAVTGKAVVKCVEAIATIAVIVIKTRYKICLKKKRFFNRINENIF
jgi:hypothetical protein